MVAKSDKNNIRIYEGYGTGVLDQEVNVFHIDHNRFGAVPVDHPMAIVNRNMKTSLIPTLNEELGL